MSRLQKITPEERGSDLVAVEPNGAIASVTRSSNGRPMGTGQGSILAVSGSARPSPPLGRYIPWKPEMTAFSMTQPR